MNISIDELASLTTKAIQQAVQRGYYIVFDSENDISNKTVDPLVALALYLCEGDESAFEDPDGDFDPRLVATLLQNKIGLTWNEALEFDRGCIAEEPQTEIWRVARRVCDMIEGLSRNVESD